VIDGPHHHEDVEQRIPLYDRWLWIGAGLLLGLFAIAIQLWRTVEFDQSSPGVLVAATLLHVGAGIAFLFVMLRGRRYRRAAQPLLLGIVALGVLLRIAAGPAAPAWEDDYYRYLWDGAAVSNGINPYAHPPEAAGSEEASELGALAAEAGIVQKRINHPHLRTIYPPLAQVSFAAAYHISPWSFNAWRGVILLHDLATLTLLILLLRALGLPSILCAIYWINPLVVKEFYQSAHMDVLLLPWLVGAMLMIVRSRAIIASALLAAATAVKLWPAILLPMLLRREVSRPRMFVLAGTMFMAFAALLLAPMLIHEPAAGSGLARYAEAWQNNAGFYTVHHAFWVHALPFIGVEAWHSQMVTRWATAILLIGWIAVIAWPRVIDGHDIVKRCLLAAAALFLISPTQFPWYFLWLVPLLAIWPVRALLLYTALLPLYHLNEITLWVIWVQHVPVWGLLIHDGLRHISRTNRGDLLLPSAVSTWSPNTQDLQQT